MGVSIIINIMGVDISETIPPLLFCNCLGLRVMEQCSTTSYHPMKDKLLFTPNLSIILYEMSIGQESLIKYRSLAT